MGGKTEDGLFLVRESSSVKGDFVIVLSFQAEIHEYKILSNKKNSNHFHIENGPSFRGEYWPDIISLRNQDVIAWLLDEVSLSSGPSSPDWVASIILR